MLSKSYRVFEMSKCLRFIGKRQKNPHYFFSVQCTVYSVQCTVYSVQEKLTNTKKARFQKSN